MARTTRGQRNNNPLNIRNSDDLFNGEIIPSTDKQFKQFKDVTKGLRAAFRILDTYNVKYHLDTVRQLISRWAPKTENATDKYVRMVCDRTLLHPAQHIDIRSNKYDSILLVAAMAQIESNMKIDCDTLIYAYNLAFPTAADRV